MNPEDQRGLGKVAPHSAGAGGLKVHAMACADSVILFARLLALVFYDDFVTFFEEVLCDKSGFGP